MSDDTHISVEEMREDYAQLLRDFRLKIPKTKRQVRSKYEEMLITNKKYRGERKRGYDVDIHNISERISALYIEDYMHTYSILVYFMEVIQDALKEGETVLLPDFVGISGTTTSPIFTPFKVIKKNRADGNKRYKGNKKG